MSEKMGHRCFCENEREALNQYISGYLECPETEEEIGWVETACQEVLAEYPWEDNAEQWRQAPGC